MAKKQFKAESKRLLDLMINSIYTHKEIFLREIISNASDAVDKLCYLSLTDDKVGMTRDDFFIKITPDKQERTITVSDNGIGMNKEDLENNLGVIAKSGSFDFKKNLEEGNDTVDIIGQFGVGFYSAFMVSQSVTVISKKYGEQQAYKWYSEGADGFTVTECERDGVGTDIIMKLKEDGEDENYSEFLEQFRIMELVKKYSDYVRYPIKMEVEDRKYIPAEKEGEEGRFETTTELKTINSMTPIWQRSRSEVSDEDAAKFYQEHFFDYEKPLRVIRVNAEGAVTYKAMLFIPAKAPYDFYTRDFKAGLQLYTSGVMIMENCAELVPEHFRFVRGIVDSQDLSLNISREMLQHNRQLKVIAANLEKRIKTELKKVMTSEPEAYEKFFKEFGLQLKYGVLKDYGQNKDLLADLMLYYSAKEKKLVSLSDYVKAMPEEQKNIYFACGESVARIDALPQTEQLREKGYDILYMTDTVDEFVANTIREFEGKELKSILSGDLGLGEEGAKEKLEKKEEESKDILAFVKETLGDKVSEVKLSDSLKSHPCCLAAKGQISFEMEKYFSALPGAAPVKAEKVLELNAEHPVFARLTEAIDKDKDKAKEYAELLYYQALLTADLPIDDTARFAELITELMK